MILENLKKYQITLASNSPRRKELLSGLNLDYKVKILPDIDETYPDTLKGEDIPLYIARKKAEAYKSIMSKNELIITADTIVYTDGEVLGKPTSRFQRSFASVTEVTFDTLTDEEVDFYISTYNPMDKAGAYGIQEWIGFIGVSKLNGSYFNVMGLPVQRLYRELKNID